VSDDADVESGIHGEVNFASAFDEDGPCLSPMISLGLGRLAHPKARTQSRPIETLLSAITAGVYRDAKDFIAGFRRGLSHDAAEIGISFVT
jgi:hypothetical protein